MLGLVWLMVPLALAVGWLGDTAPSGAAVAATSAALATVAWWFAGSTAFGRALSGVLLMAQISVLVAEGGAWQVDLHMAYFAAPALLVVYNDWRVIVALRRTAVVPFRVPARG